MIELHSFTHIRTPLMAPSSAPTSPSIPVPDLWRFACVPNGDSGDAHMAPFHRRWELSHAFGLYLCPARSFCLSKSSTQDPCTESGVSHPARPDAEEADAPCRFAISASARSRSLCVFDGRPLVDVCAGAEDNFLWMAVRGSWLTLALASIRLLSALSDLGGG